MASVNTCYKALVSLEDIDVELERWKFKFTDSTEKKGLDYCYAATKNLYPNFSGGHTGDWTLVRKDLVGPTFFERQTVKVNIS